MRRDADGARPLHSLQAMRPVLIVHESTHGHTTKIAEKIAEHIREARLGAHVDHSGEAEGLNLGAFASVVIGGSIHGGEHVQAKLIEFVQDHRAILDIVPTSFFVVCMAASKHGVQAQEEVARYFENFERDTGFHPKRVAAFGDELHYTEYGPLEKLAVRVRASLRPGSMDGVPTDTSRDHDLTDWASVAAFARVVAADAVEASAGRPSNLPPPHLL